MSLWSQYRLIDILTHMDMALVEEEFPEGDLDNLELFPESRKWDKKKVAVVSGVAAAGSIALTGVVVFMCRRYSALRKAG